MNTVIDLKKLLIGGSVALLLAPVFAFAAYNDVTLTTDTTVLSVNGITVNVTGASAEIESIVVSATDFTVTLATGSSIDITAPNRNVFSVNTITDQVTNVCTSADSKLGYLATGALTLVVTPQTSLCSSATGSVGVSSGGGGGGSSVATQTTTQATTTATTTTATVTTTTATTEPTSAASDATALENQLEALQTQLAQLQGASVVFTRDLEVGGTGDDVLALQQFLNANGFLVSESGPGSPGNETTTFGGLTRAALAAFQAANGISPAVGYFGPKTRAFVVGAGTTSVPSMPSISTTLVPGFFTRDLEVGSTGEDARALQQFLNEQGFMVSESGPGSPGNETTMFGGLTRAALAAFQTANGISPAVGYFGPKTRAFIAGM